MRGALNPFSPLANTNLNVVFRNVDMVPASPYAMKFAGYRIAEGKISLDLRYRVRDRKLEGDNKIVIDKLTLGERVDSPDALKLPLELAIAVLKDADGRIELGLPVTGDLSDPQFSYAAVLWKAFSNVLTSVVTAPFRALAGLFGGSGEKLQAIEFDPGSDRLLPPEREKLLQVAQLLARRGQLRLSVPGQFSEAADGAALRARSVRVEIARRAGLSLEADEAPGPLDLTDAKVRGAVRELFTQRFGAPAVGAGQGGRGDGASARRGQRRGGRIRPIRCGRGAGVAAHPQRRAGRAAGRRCRGLLPRAGAPPGAGGAARARRVGQAWRAARAGRGRCARAGRRRRGARGGGPARAGAGRGRQAGRREAGARRAALSRSLRGRAGPFLCRAGS